MGRLRDWLVGRYLPNWAVQTILEENRRLRSQAEELRREYRTLRAYTTAWSMPSGTACMLRSM